MMCNTKKIGFKVSNSFFLDEPPANNDGFQYIVVMHQVDNDDFKYCNHTECESLGKCFFVSWIVIQ